jgi:hypothetical protein
MKIVKKVKLFLVAFWWFIRFEEVKVLFLQTKKDEILPDTEANRKFVEEWQGKGIYKNINFILVKVTYFGYDRTGALIICMTLPTTGQVITARLALGKTSDSIVTQARNIKSKCTGNVYVTFTITEIGDLGTAINAYEDAHGADRDVAFTTLNNMLKNIFLDRISKAAIGDPTHSIVLIQSCGCHVQGVGGAKEQVFDGFAGVASGTIVLVGKAGGQNTCHEWWSSVDNINWVRLEGTINANTLVTGCVPGAAMYFRHQIIDSNGGQGLTDPIMRRAN